MILNSLFLLVWKKSNSSTSNPRIIVQICSKQVVPNITWWVNGQKQRNTGSIMCWFTNTKITFVQTNLSADKNRTVFKCCWVTWDVSVQGWAIWWYTPMKKCFYRGICYFFSTNVAFLAVLPWSLLRTIVTGLTALWFFHSTMPFFGDRYLFGGWRYEKQLRP